MSFHTLQADERPERLEHPSPPDSDMVRIPGGTFRMGSDRHYPEEAPAHRVTVDAFWIDRTPVTNRQFTEFVEATRHVTFAEISPDPKDYPGALLHMLYAGSLVFSPLGAGPRCAGKQCKARPANFTHHAAACGA
jgi:sulfatase modifying factor 1